jgi:hypothetical protein
MPDLAAIERAFRRLAATAPTIAEHQARLRARLQPFMDVNGLLHAHCPAYAEHRPENTPEAALTAARERVVARLLPGLRRPLARRALMRAAAERQISPQQLIRTELFPEAILVVSGEAATPQRMRIGQQWVTDEYKKVRTVPPVKALSPGEFIQWWTSRVYAAAGAILLGEDYPRPTDKQAQIVLYEQDAVERLVAADSQHVRESGMFVALLDDEEDATDRLEQLLADAAPRARELILLLRQGCSRNDAARMMGISRSTVDNLLTRERQKHRR